MPQGASTPAAVPETRHRPTGTWAPSEETLGANWQTWWKAGENEAK